MESVVQSRVDALVERLRVAIREHHTLVERRRHAEAEALKMGERATAAQYKVAQARKELEEFLASATETPPMEVRRTVAEHRYGGVA